MRRNRILTPLLGLGLLLSGMGSAFAEPLTLEACLQRAFVQSKRLQMERAKVRAAEAKVREARADRLPQVSVTATYTYAPWLPKSVLDIQFPEGAVPQDEQNPQQPSPSGAESPSGESVEQPPAEQPPTETEQPPPGEAGETPTQEGTTSPAAGFPLPSGPIEVEMGAHHSGMVGATLQQPLFTWGKIRNHLAQAEASLEAARQGLLAAEQQLRLEVTEAFYGVLLAQEYVKVSQRALEQIQKHRDTAQLLVDTGAATRFDLLRAEVQLANVKSQLIRAQNGLKLAKENLRLLLSMPPGEPLEVIGNLETQVEDVPLVKLIEQALRQRPDLKQLEYQERAGEKLVRIAHAANKPNLALVSNYQFALSDRQREGNHMFNVTLALNFPLFDGFKTRAQARQAEIGLEQIQLGKSQLEDAIRLEVKAAYLSLHQARALLEAQQETVQQAQEGLRIANLQYENGMITSVQLTDSELALTQAEVNRLQALHDLAVAKARLEKAVGQPWNP